ncbi:MAG: helix-turn-helix transcriptional regulator [Acidimicrobiales bacterium]
MAPVERVDRLERLTDLVLVLLDTTRALTLTEIADAVIGYPEAGETRRQAFERDKRTLRDEGIVVTAEPIPYDPSLTGYRIRPQDYYLPPLDLSPDEQVALNLAVAGVHLDDSTGRDALLKLGVMERDGPAAVAALPSLPALPALHEAVRSHAPVRFGYRGRSRTVDPYALAFRGGWWYLLGRDHEHDERRTFRVDRMEPVEGAGPPGSFDPPEDLDAPAVLAQGPWRLGQEDAGVAHVLVDAVLAGEVAGQLAGEAVVETREDGSVVVALEVANVAAFRSWVLGLLDHAVVLGPPPLRDSVTGWLAAMRAGGVGVGGGEAARDTGAGGFGGGARW